MSPLLLIAAAGGAVVGAGLKFLEIDAEAKKQEAAIKARRLGAKMQFSAVEDSTNIMKATTREQTVNAVGETLRAGYNNSTKTKQAVDKAVGTSIAKQEGLTSGRSQGRAMVSLYVQGSKAVQESDAQTKMSINKLVDQQDKISNDLNNKLLQAHQELAAVLSDEGPKIDGTVAIIGAGISGATSFAGMAK